MSLTVQDLVINDVSTKGSDLMAGCMIYHQLEFVDGLIVRQD